MKSELSGQKSFFRFNNKVHTQIDNRVCASRYGIHEGVTMVAIQVSKLKTLDIFEDIQNFIYDNKIQLKLHKQYLRYMDEKAFEEKQRQTKEKGKIRNLDPARKAAMQEIDRKRNKTPKRKAEMQEIDRERNKTPKRKAEMQKIDKERNKTPEVVAKNKNLTKSGIKHQ